MKRLKSDSSTLIKVPDPSTVFGEVGKDLVEVRSKCSSGDGFYTMDMEYRRSRKGQVIGDKLTNIDYNWTNLFPVVPMTCPKTQCMQSTLPVTPTVVDFENIPGASEGKIVDAAMNNYLKGAYGISFVSVAGGEIALAKIAQQDDPEVSFRGWMSVLCPGNPSWNRLCNGGGGGRWLLSAIKAVSSYSVEFDVYYDYAAKTAEFDLADHDDSETWSITPYDASNSPIGAPRVFKANPGYGSNTGNNKLTHITISSTSKNIRRLNFNGSKHIAIMGLGFDNFTTGIEYCKSINDKLQNITKQSNLAP